MGVTAFSTEDRRTTPRGALELPARLHLADGVPGDVAVLDLTAHGCRIIGANAPEPGSYVTLALTRAIIIAGRIAWSETEASGVDFCQALRPRALAQALAAA